METAVVPRQGVLQAEPPPHMTTHFLNQLNAYKSDSTSASRIPEINTGLDWAASDTGRHSQAVRDFP
ncbi:Ff.00g133510.m01.CDS01 [Fusarium sp. VM40]|nr:Ff.00g133510.m01.CDS01 [Fusarium sp. VM40]